MFSDLELEEVATAFPRIKSCIGYTAQDGGQAAALKQLYEEAQKPVSYSELKDKHPDEYKSMIDSLRSQLAGHNVDRLFTTGLSRLTSPSAPSADSWFNQVEAFNPVRQEYSQFMMLANPATHSSQERKVEQKGNNSVPVVPTDSQLYSCCRKRFMEGNRFGFCEQYPKLDVHVISDKSNKHRVITTAKIEESYLAQNLNKKLIKALKRISSVEALLNGREVKLTRERKDSSIYSADLSKATDYIPLNIAKLFLEKFLERIGVSEQEVQVALRIIGKHDLQHGNIHNRGLFMGLGVSWTILCLINDFCARDAGAIKGTYAIHGDDLVGFWSRNLKERYESNITSLGLVINNSKSFYGPGGVFCERFLETDLKLRLNRVFNPNKFSYLISPSRKDVPLQRSKQVDVTSVSYNRLAECGGSTLDYETNKADMSGQLLKIRSPFREVRDLVRTTLKKICLYKRGKARKATGKLFKGRMDCGGDGTSSRTDPVRTLAFIKIGKLINSSRTPRSSIYLKAMNEVHKSTDACTNTSDGLDIEELKILLLSAERRKALLVGEELLSIPKFNPKDIVSASIQARQLGVRILQTGPVGPSRGFNSRSRSLLRRLSKRLIASIKGNRLSLAHKISRRAVRVISNHTNKQSWSLNWARDWTHSYGLQLPSNQSGGTLSRYVKRIPIKVVSDIREESNPSDSSYRLGDVLVKITDPRTVIGRSNPDG
jgi:hypothetical protein